MLKFVTKMFEFRDLPPKFMACAACAAATGVGVVLYKTLRPKFSIKVNCWFCNKDSIVPYGNRNCWDCIYCDQYNGFREDGDYNKPIPSQYTEEFNHPISAVQQENQTKVKSDILCAECNRNQLLKISQLANFEPRIEANYDHEIELFRHNLEHIYRLCPDCEHLATRRIERQDRRLEQKYGIQHPQSPSSSHNVSTISNRSSRSNCSDHHLLCHLRAPFHIRLLRFLTLLCAAILFTVNLHRLQTDAKLAFVRFPKKSIHYIELVYRSASPLLVFGPLTALAAMFLHGPNRMVSADILHLTFWMILCPLQTNLIPFKREDNYLLRTLCAFFMLVLAGWCWLCGRSNVRQSPIRIVKKRLRDSPASSVMTNSNSRTNSPNTSQNGDGQIRTGRDFINLGSMSKVRRPDDGPLNKLGTMSLGPPSHGKKKASSVFNSSSQVTSTSNPLMSSLFRHAQKRPLISPARFKGAPSQPSLLKASSWPPKILPQRQPTWVDSNSSIHPNESVSQCGDRHSDESNSSNSSSSVCPVGTTTNCQYAEEDLDKSGPGTKSFIVKEYVFAFSLAANILIGTFMFLNWNVLKSYFAVE
ncbi:transmembrane protein 201-like [Lineus longissimus]|uniref:transmembrane protein 201-like n=1 Tax=Lineus longissimus TaxID=88925 RepID=UPI002B4E0602